MRNVGLAAGGRADCLIPMIAGIELGGTKAVVALGHEDGTVAEEFRFPTTDGPGTLATALAWIAGRGPVEALGVAAFGPVRIDPAANDCGTVLATPKPGWSGFSILRAVSGKFPGLPVRIETDVNAAALAEADGLADVAYVTIGTGIGAGIVSGGRLIHGLVHPEFGHWYPRRAEGDDFRGVCPFHGDCLEGLASGPAMAARWGREARELPAGHEAWRIEVDYLAQAVLALLACASPRRVVIGGGVAQAEGFHDAVGRRVVDLAAGYFPAAASTGFIVAPVHGQQAGIRGALLLGAAARG